MNKIVLIPFLILINSCSHNTKKNESFSNIGVKNCSQLFDSIQGSYNSPDKQIELREIYEEYCK